MAKCERDFRYQEDVVDAGTNIITIRDDSLFNLLGDLWAAIKRMRAAHEVADSHNDIATASILENFIDQAEKRNWFLFEASRSGSGGGALRGGVKSCTSSGVYSPTSTAG